MTFTTICLAGKTIIATAEQLVEKADDSQEWSFFGGAATFTIRGQEDNGLECNLQGNLGYPVSYATHTGCLTNMNVLFE